MITLEKITKDFRVHRRDPGLKNAVRSLFTRDTTVVRALNEVSFSIGDGEMVGYMAKRRRKVHDRQDHVRHSHPGQRRLYR